ncbi:MAG: hypothetical protein ACERKD_00115 [Prolixibacteraceae bacterium]
MKRIVLTWVIISILSVLPSCLETNKEISLFNGLKFELNKGEVVNYVDMHVNDKYTRYFNNRKIQIPLFKYIKNADYEIFIGVPFNTTIDAFIQDQLKNQDFATTKITYDSISCYKNSKMDNFYIVEYARNYSNKSLLYIAAISNSLELSDSLFSMSQLSNRIISR